MPVEIEIALATEIPILIPVKEPGLRDTKIRPRSLNLFLALQSNDLKFINVLFNTSLGTGRSNIDIFSLLLETIILASDVSIIKIFLFFIINLIR